MSNATAPFPSSAFLDSLVPNPVTFPFYHITRPSILPFISDKSLSLVAPFLAYWVWSLLFHVLDTAGWKWVEKYRIHESEEAKSKNIVSRWEVLKAVLLQQAIQTGLGWYWMEPDVEGPGAFVSHSKTMRELSPWVAKAAAILCGKQTGDALLANHGREIVHYVYWWGIPIAQFFFAMCVLSYIFLLYRAHSPKMNSFILDTWEYFLHRLFHTSKYLYRHFHSYHHRLYVPYAYGALYNHWFEGLLFDSLGAVVAHSTSMMNIRQAILLFTISTLKTVDDHCGYKLPFDPFQLLWSNNASYHDIHHRVRCFAGFLRRS
jgi:sphinganine C4-monooxygenase